jgi:hypothetical protein
MWPIAIGLVLAYIYLVVPLIVYLRRRPLSEALVTEWSTTDHAFFNDAETTLQRIGFSPPTHVSSKGGRFVTHMSILLDRGGLTVATIASVADGRRRAVAFRSQFGDGQMLVTTNQSIGRLLPRLSFMHGVRCAGVTDPASLLEIHRRQLAKVSAVAAIPDGDVLGYANRETRRLRDELGARGYVDEAERITLRGTFLMAWRRLPPWKQINDWSDARAAAAFLA